MNPIKSQRIPENGWKIPKYSSEFQKWLKNQKKTQRIQQQSLQMVEKSQKILQESLKMVEKSHKIPKNPTMIL